MWWRVVLNFLRINRVGTSYKLSSSSSTYYNCIEIEEIHSLRIEMP